MVYIAKARVSFAQVGNDLDPYQLYNVYGIGSIYETGGTSAVCCLVVPYLMKMYVAN